jgi:hypothetical protein
MKNKREKKTKTKTNIHHKVDLNAPPRQVVYPNVVTTINLAINHIYGGQSKLSRILGISRQAIWQRVCSAEETGSAHAWWAAVSLLPDDTFHTLAGENPEKRSYLKESGLDELSAVSMLLLRAFMTELVSTSGKWEGASKDVRHAIYIEKLRSRAKNAKAARLDILGT